MLNFKKDKKGKENMKNKKYLMLGMFVLIVNLLMVNFVQANINTSDPEYLKVLNEFDNAEWVRVLVKIKPDTPNWNVDKSVNEIVEEAKRLQEKVIPYLPESDFKDINQLDATPGFYITITMKGLDILINNSNVESIKLPGITHGSLDNGFADQIEDDKKELEQNFSYLWIIGIFIVIILVILLLIKRRKR